MLGIQGNVTRSKTLPRLQEIKRQFEEQYQVSLELAGQLPTIAFYMSEVCPEDARNMIRELVKEGKEHRDWLQSAAQAAVRLDAQWAVEIARSIDPTPDARNRNCRAEALRKIAQYLLATPEDRQKVNFVRWSASDTWFAVE